MNYIIIFDVIIAALGLYLIYSAQKMKNTGEICEILLNREETKKCKDKQGFICKIYKKTCLFGTLSVLFGIFGCVNDTLYPFGRLYDIGSVAIYLIAWFWFSRELRSARGDFFY